MKISSEVKKFSFVIILLTVLSIQIMTYITSFIFTGYFMPNENIALRNGLTILGAFLGAVIDLNLKIDLKKKIYAFSFFSVMTNILIFCAHHFEEDYDIFALPLAIFVILVSSEAVKILSELIEDVELLRVGGIQFITISIILSLIEGFSLISRFSLVDSTVLITLVLSIILPFLLCKEEQQKKKLKYEVPYHYYYKDLIFILFLTFIFVLGTGRFHIYNLTASVSTIIFYLIFGLSAGIIILNIKNQIDKSLIISIILIFEILFTFMALTWNGDTIYILGINLWELGGIGHKFFLTFMVIIATIMLKNLKQYITKSQFIPGLWTFSLVFISLNQMIIKLTQSYYIIPIVMVISRGIYLLLLPILIVTSYISFSSKPKIDLLVITTRGGLPVFYIPQDDTMIKISNFVSVIQNYIDSTLKQKLVSFVLDDENIVISYGKQVIGIAYTTVSARSVSQNLRIVVDIFEKYYNVEKISVIESMKYEEVSELIQHFFIIGNNFFSKK